MNDFVIQDFVIWPPPAWMCQTVSDSSLYFTREFSCQLERCLFLMRHDLRAHGVVAQPWCDGAPTNLINEVKR